jgi:AP2 domain/HNH endonuclease
MKYNVKRHAVEQPLDQSIKIIPLTKGYNSIVDAKNYERLLRLNWCATETKDGRVYAIAKEPIGNGQFRKVFMHREIFYYKYDLVDHKDGDGLNNREDNLRPCTPAQNAANRRTPSNNTSGYKGVTWFECRKCWLAQSCENNKRVHLGLFPNTPEGKIEAARTYDRFMIKTRGQFAKTNFPLADYD